MTSLHVDPHLWLAVAAGFAQVFRSAREFERIDVSGGALAVTGLPAPDLNCGVVSTGDDPAAAFRPDLLTADDVAIELICDGDVPVGCLQVTAGDNVVGIWSMATPPEHRRRGIARAGLEHVLANRLAVAESRAFLIATEAGRPLYDAVGFETVAWCTAWLQAGPAEPRA